MWRLSINLPLLQIESAALDLRGYDDTVLPEAYQRRLDRSDVFQILRIVLEFLGTELLYDGTGANHRVLADDTEEFLLPDWFHG